MIKDSRRLDARCCDISQQLLLLLFLDLNFFLFQDYCRNDRVSSANDWSFKLEGIILRLCSHGATAGHHCPIFPLYSAAFPQTLDALDTKHGIRTG